jgi:4-carboxymuconolactone decarboxylase
MSEGRFPQARLEELEGEARALAEKIVKVSSLGLGGPYNAMLRSPVLGDRLFELLRYLRWESSLPLRLSEFAILIVGRLWRSQIEWLAHEPIALREGLSPAIVAELKANRRPADMPPEEAAVYDFVTELATRHKVSDETFARARALFTEQQLVDLTAVAGTYITVAMLIAMPEAPIPAGRKAPFEPDES